MMDWRLVLCVLLTNSVVQHAMAQTQRSTQSTNSACNRTGVTLTGTSGRIRFPHDYSRSYPDNADCRWHIQAPEGQRVQITREWDSIKDSVGCKADSLNFYDGSGTNSPLLASWCGYPRNYNLYDIIQSTSNHLYVYFTSDNSSTHTYYAGFEISYKSGSAPCDGLVMNLTAEGNITSPNYPNNYPNNADCEWQIHAPADKIIVLQFESFDIEGKNCEYDRLSLRNAHNQIYLCGDNINTESQLFPSNKLIIKFTSDGSVVHKGFKLKYSFMDAPPAQQCNGSAVTLMYPVGISTRGYPNNATCEWLIKAPVNKEIKLRSFGYTSGRCSFKVYNGMGQSAPLLVDLCEQYHRWGITLQSTSNYLFLQYTSIQHSYYSSLKITYAFINPRTRAQCNGVNLTSEGVITSPGFPDRQPSNASCSWHIEAPAPKKIQLDLEFFGVGGYHGRCHGSHLKVYNGQDTSAPVLAILCGRSLPTIPLSTSNFLFLKLITNTDYGTGFKLKFRFLDPLTGDEPCHGKVIRHTSPAIIMSPNYPGKYPTNTTCEWEVQAPAGQRIHLQSEDIDIAYQRSDYINIYEGNSTNGPLLASLRRMMLWKEELLTNGLISRTNRLFVIFHSNARRMYGGFKFNFTFVDPPADSEYSAPCEGTPARFTSPGQITVGAATLHVVPFQLCKWEIQAPDRKRIQVRFERFYLPAADESICHENSLKVYDGRWPNPSRMTSLCGKHNPSPLTSTTDFLLLQLLSNNHYWDSYGKSLQLNFTFTDAPVLSGFSICDSINLLTSDSEYIVSPWDIRGDFYPPNTHCTLRVKAPSGKNVILAVEGDKFKLESSTNCTKDYLTIYNGNGGTASKLGQFCGTIFPKGGLKSTGDELFLIFHSDDVLSRNPGFNLSVSFILSEPSCGDVLTGNTRLLESPNYPDDYPNFAKCRWTITVAEDETVVLEFANFALEYDYLSCRYDAVAVYDGLTKSATSLGKFCGSTIPYVIRSTRRHLLVEFTSDGSVVKRGFRAKFTAIIPETGCGGAITDHTGQLKSPDFNIGYYPNNAKCSWNITVAENKIVRLEFGEFELQYDFAYVCRYDAVAVYDGLTKSATRLGKFCGSTIPGVIRSTGRHLLVEFTSDGLVVKRGFQANFTAISSVIADLACGKNSPAILNETEGNIASPGDPPFGNYPHNSYCQWRVQVTNGKYAQLHVNRFNLEFGASSCPFDYLEVYDGPNNRSPKFGRYCGTSIHPTHFTSNGSTIFVQFKSDSSVTARGFDITYSAKSP